MGKVLKTVDAVIDALGGTNAVAILCKRRPSAVSNWRAKKMLPSKLYIVIASALRDQGLKARPGLWSMPEPDKPAVPELAEAS